MTTSDVGDYISARQSSCDIAKEASSRLRNLPHTFLLSSLAFWEPFQPALLPLAQISSSWLQDGPLNGSAGAPRSFSPHRPRPAASVRIAHAPVQFDRIHVSERIWDEYRLASCSRGGILSLQTRRAKHINLKTYVPCRCKHSPLLPIFFTKTLHSTLF